MTTVGVVRLWHDDAGWGVIDSLETPGGCWAHFSAVAVAGYRSLTPGAEVALEWEIARQDGFAYRAVRTWPVAEQPVPTVHDGQPAAYTSTLTITYDDEP